jgi:hypothetical protein
MTSEEKNRLQIIWFSSPSDSISITTDLGRVTLKPHNLVCDSAIKAPRSVLYHRQGSKSIGSSTIPITAASMMIIHRFRVCSPLQQIIALPFNKTRKLLLTVSAAVLKDLSSHSSRLSHPPFHQSIQTRKRKDAEDSRVSRHDSSRWTCHLYFGGRCRTCLASPTLRASCERNQVERKSPSSCLPVTSSSMALGTIDMSI